VSVPCYVAVHEGRRLRNYADGCRPSLPPFWFQVRASSAYHGGISDDHSDSGSVPMLPPDLAHGELSLNQVAATPSRNPPILNLRSRCRTLHVFIPSNSVIFPVFLMNGIDLAVMQQCPMQRSRMAILFKMCRQMSARARALCRVWSATR
jgi:hypothetical protein